ncbi:MAG TPA: TolC family protein [Gemmatimonadota bacterium]|jgi:outer membrane protein TolC
MRVTVRLALPVALAALAWIPAALAAQDADSLRAARPDTTGVPDLAGPPAPDSLAPAPLAADTLGAMDPLAADTLGEAAPLRADTLGAGARLAPDTPGARAPLGADTLGAAAPPGGDALGPFGASRAGGAPDSGAYAPGADAAAPAADGIPLSLEEAERLALERNERILIAEEEIERTRGLVREVRAQALPSLDLTYRYARNIQRPVIFFDQGGEVQQISVGQDNDNTIALSVEQTLFSRSVTAAGKAAATAQQVSRFALEDTGEQLVLDVRARYFAALLNAELVHVQEQALAQAQARLQQVERFFEVGTAAEFDRLTAEVEVENIRPILIQARNDLALSLNELKRVTGLPLDAEIQLTDRLTYEPVTLTLGEAQDLARVQRDDLRRQRAQVQFQQQTLAVERAESFPELALTFDLSRRASSEEFVPATEDFSQSATAGVELTVPVFDGRAVEGRVRQARADLAQEELALRALEADAALQVQQALQNVRAAAERIEAARATVGLAERALEIATTRFRAGLSTQLELNDAELALVQARVTNARALHDYNLARAQFLRAIGER